MCVDIHVSAQRLAFINMIVDLRRAKRVVKKKLKPWGNTTLHISQDAHIAIAHLHQMLEYVTTAPKGLASLTLVNIAQQAVA